MTSWRHDDVTLLLLPTEKVGVMKYMQYFYTYSDPNIF